MRTHKVNIIKPAAKKDDDNVIDIREEKLTAVASNGGFTVNGDSGAIQVRSLGSVFGNKGFYLSSMFDWVITEDEAGTLVLVPYLRG